MAPIKLNHPGLHDKIYQLTGAYSPEVVLHAALDSIDSAFAGQYLAAHKDAMTIVASALKLLHPAHQVNVLIKYVKERETVPGIDIVSELLRALTREHRRYLMDQYDDEGVQKPNERTTAQKVYDTERKADDALRALENIANPLHAVTLTTAREYRLKGFAMGGTHTATLKQHPEVGSLLHYSPDEETTWILRVIGHEYECGTNSEGALPILLVTVQA
jgi:hypothetical protein